MNPHTRSSIVKWPQGCPLSSECCSEFGYCRPQVTRHSLPYKLFQYSQDEWLTGNFLDCNGLSNGQQLEPQAIVAEAAAAAAGMAIGYEFSNNNLNFKY